MEQQKPLSMNEFRQQTLLKTHKQTFKWLLVLLGFIVFGCLFGAGAYGILHSFDLFGGVTTPAEKVFSSFAPIGLFGGLIFFSLISLKFTERSITGLNVVKIIRNTFLYILLSIPFAFAAMYFASSTELIEKVDTYLVNRNESQRQSTIDKVQVNITFVPKEVISYSINKDFAALVIKGQLNGLESASQITSYMNVVGMEKLTINDQLVNLPKPDQWDNMPSTIRLGTDEPPQVSFASKEQELSLLVIVPADSIQVKSVNSISGTLAIWSQSENTFDQEIIWEQEFATSTQIGKNPESEKVLQDYLIYRK